MTRTNRYPTIACRRAGLGAGFDMAVLIEVPQLRAPLARRRVARVSGDGWRTPQVRRHRPRRRLRRGVRLVGWSLLAILTLFGGIVGWSGRYAPLSAWSAVSRGGDQGRRDRAMAIEPSRSIGPAAAEIEGSYGAMGSIAPAIGAPIADAEVSVIFPGYLLPDDGREESANEGG